jgi:hypothetical protein
MRDQMLAYARRRIKKLRELIYRGWKKARHAVRQFFRYSYVWAWTFGAWIAAEHGYDAFSTDLLLIVAAAVLAFIVTVAREGGSICDSARENLLFVALVLAVSAAAIEKMGKRIGRLGAEFHKFWRD